MSFNVTIIMTLDECYEILGIKPGASEEEIKKAYRRKSLIHHPDRNNNSIESTEIFKKLNEAYDRISNHAAKEPDENLFGDGEMNIDALMKMFNDMGNHPSFSQHINRQIQKPIPIIKRVDITLEQVYRGCMVPIQIVRTIKHNGEIRDENETIYVDIPKGIDTNEMIVFREKGHVIDDIPAGDIKVFVSVLDHQLFKRSGLDLIFTREISLKQAMCGIDIEFIHLSGNLYKINNSKGRNVISPGYQKVVHGLGLQRQDHCGNLIIEFKISFPEKLSIDQITAIEKII
jgi:DnaJ-class molecular chaperone